MTREQSYRALVDARRACAQCIGLRNPAVVADGRFDSSQIGPWTVWQHRLDARVMVVGQDFSDVAYFEKNQGRDQPRNPTNQHLVALLRSIGIEIRLFDESDGRDEAFFTNAILCLKEGGMQALSNSVVALGSGQRLWHVDSGRSFSTASTTQGPSPRSIELEHMLALAPCHS